MMKLPLKWLSIFFILFAFIFTYNSACYDYKDSSLDNVPFLNQDTYQVFSNDLVRTIFTDIDLSTSLTSIPAISTRGPPV